MKFSNIIRFIFDYGYLTDIILLNKYQFDLKNYYTIINRVEYSKLIYDKELILLACIDVLDGKCVLAITLSGATQINEEIDIYNKKYKKEIPHVEIKLIKTKRFGKIPKRVEIK